jgi:hypothetical protein
LREAVKAGRLKGEMDAEQATAGVAAGIITAAEADIVREAHEARREVIRVDDFPKL